jgi:hypothetical protein
MATVGLACALGSFSLPGHCKLIEDGSSFTGSYMVQEDECGKRVFNYMTGQYDLMKDFSFKGTPEGLKADGNLMLIHPDRAFDQGSGIVTGGYAFYQSGHEFVSSFFVIDPATNQGRKKVTLDDYLINDDGDIVKTTTTTIGDGQAVTKICHFRKSI